MKRSEVNNVIKAASAFFNENGWTLPPNPKWDVTDFGLGDFQKYGLVLVNLAEETEYCEKLMYAQKGMTTPAHCHAKKKEDIICRTGEMKIQVWKGKPGNNDGRAFDIQVNNEMTSINSGDFVLLKSGERVTIIPGVYHEFYPVTDECIIGEVSTANDDLNDNFFINPDIGRYSEILEDETPLLRLLSDN